MLANKGAEGKNGSMSCHVMSGQSSLEAPFRYVANLKQRNIRPALEHDQLTQCGLEGLYSCLLLQQKSHGIRRCASLQLQH
jgi:hypothetical protein